MRALLVTGTDTGIGKTVVTAAIAAGAIAAGHRVAAVKPVQTGTDLPDPLDADVVARLGGCRAVDLVRLRAPLAPPPAARVEGANLPEIAAVARDCRAAAGDADLLLVEGAGGVLVRLDDADHTILDLGAHLREAGCAVSAVVVTSLALGTLNHTELTTRAVSAAGIEVAGLVVGAAPAELGLAEECNTHDLPLLTGVPLLGAIPEGAGDWAPADFHRSAPGWLPGLGGALAP